MCLGKPRQPRANLNRPASRIKPRHKTPVPMTEIPRWNNPPVRLPGGLKGGRQPSAFFTADRSEQRSAQTTFLSLHLRPRRNHINIFNSDGEYCSFRFHPSALSSLQVRQSLCSHSPAQLFALQPSHLPEHASRHVFGFSIRGWSSGRYSARRLQCCRRRHFSIDIGCTGCPGTHHWLGTHQNTETVEACSHSPGRG
jgi:hypothetical protein